MSDVLQLINPPRCMVIFIESSIFYMRSRIEISSLCIYMYTYSFFIISSLEIVICWYFLVKTNQHDRQKYVATWLEIFLSRILFYTNYLSIQSFDFKMIIPWFQFQWYIAVAYVNLWYAVNSKSKLFVEGREQ